MNKINFSLLLHSIYFKNTLWLLFEKILSFFYVYFIFAAIAKYLGPNQFGEFSYLLAVFSIICGIGGLGFNQFLPKDIIDNKNKIGSVLFNAFIVKLAVNILIILFILFFYTLIFKENFFYFLLPLLIFYCFDVFEFFFVAKKKINLLTISKIFQLIFGSIFFSILIFYDFDLSSFFVGYLFTELVYTLFIIVFFYFDSLKIQFIFLYDYLGDLIKKIWPLIILSLFVLIHNRIDQIMLYHFLDSKSVGIYSSALRVSEALYFIPVILSTVFIVPLVESFATNQRIFQNRLLDLIKLTFIVSIICIIFLLICGNFLILTFFGLDYYEAFQILFIHSFVCIPVFISVINNNWYVCKQAYKSLMYISLISILINIFLNYYWIRLYGMQGAAYATLVSKIFLAFFGNLFFDDTRENFKFSTLFIFKLFSLNFLRNKS